MLLQGLLCLLKALHCQLGFASVRELALSPLQVLCRIDPFVTFCNQCVWA